MLILQDLAADCVRIERLLNFGRDILGGLNPAVLAGNGTIDQLRSDQKQDPVNYYIFFSKIILISLFETAIVQYFHLLFPFFFLVQVRFYAAH